MNTARGANHLPKLTILFGAGSTIGSGMPSTPIITDRLLQLGQPNTPTAGQIRPFFSELSNILITHGGFSSVNFEHLLHAMEMLEPLLGNYDNHPFQINDYFRPVLKPLVEPTESTQQLLCNGCSISYWRGTAFRQIAQLFSESVSNSQPKETHLADFLSQLTPHFTLRLFTLNYDDLVDRVQLPWNDGFVSNNSDYYQPFDPKQFLSQNEAPAPLLVHLHGSTRFGYAQDGIFDIHKYKSPEVALNHAQDKGFSQNVNGKMIFSGPMISGLSKIEQLLYRPCPYGYYLKSFIDNVLETPRLLVLGYGGLDRHINEWILQFAQLHGRSSKLAYVAPVETFDTQAVIGAAANTLEPLCRKSQLPYYGQNLAVETALFPFEDGQVSHRLIDFLAK